MISRTKLLGGVISLIIIGVVGYNYIYQDHRNIETEAAAFSLTAENITQLFKKDKVGSEQKFLNKTIEVTGNITEKTTRAVTINDQVFCQLLNPIDTKALEEEIKIKGRVIGYDDLLEQIKLDQCTIIKIE